MMRNRPYFIFLAIMVMMLTLTTARAQNPVFGNDTKPEDREVDMDNPTFVPMVKVGKVLHGKDSIQYVELNNVYVYPPQVFKTPKQRQRYNRLVYNVKKVLPIAKEVNHIIIETYEYLQTLPHEARGGMYQEGIHAEDEEADADAGKAAHKTGIQRVQLVVVPAGEGIPRSDKGWILSGFRMDIRCEPHEEI